MANKWVCPYCWWFHWVIPAVKFLVCILQCPPPEWSRTRTPEHSTRRWWTRCIRWKSPWSDPSWCPNAVLRLSSCHTCGRREDLTTTQLQIKVIFWGISHKILPFHFLLLSAKSSHSPDGGEHLVSHGSGCSVGLQLHPRQLRHKLEAGEADGRNVSSFESEERERRDPQNPAKQNSLTRAIRAVPTPISGLAATMTRVSFHPFTKPTQKPHTKVVKRWIKILTWSAMASLILLISL